MVECLANMGDWKKTKSKTGKYEHEQFDKMLQIF